MRRLLILAALLTATVRADETLGKIGEIEIKTSELRESLAGLQTSQESALAADPAAIGQYVRALLIQRLLLKQATDSRFDQDPAVIAKLVRARETALTEAYLDSFSQPPENYPTDAEIQSAYDSAKAGLIIPKSFRLAQIFIKDPARLEGVAKQLKAKNADFAAIAKASSDEPKSAANGGEIGWLSEAQIQAEIREKLPKLATGTISEPVKLADGHHFIKIIETREPSTATLDQVRPQLIAKLRAERSKQLRQDHLAAILKENPVAINEIELNKILPKAGR